MVNPSQTTYTIIGSTGNCGTALIELLLQDENAKINAYCRNKNKLLRLIPDVVDNKKVQIFEGNIQDQSILADCCRGAKTVFLVASTNSNIPGCRISQDLAVNVIGALEKLRDEAKAEFEAPKLVLLSSATIDPHLSRHIPVLRWVMLRAASYIYEDLRVAEAYLRTKEDWVKTIYMKPGGLSVDIQRGHEITLDDEESFISYLDVAAAMLEAADDEDGKYDFKNVGVKNAGAKAKFPPGTPKCVIYGLLRHYFPFLDAYLSETGPV